MNLDVGPHAGGCLIVIYAVILLVAVALVFCLA
ncbi:hypothetical protein ACVISU_000014 [Bradyrhizobium sp. USDA 4452]